MQTLELENYGAVELSTDEQREMDGGYGYHAGHGEFSAYWSDVFSSMATGILKGIKEQIDLCKCL